MKKILPITIVCPSHKGQKKLPKLINSIYKNSCWPKEIIICATNKLDFKHIDPIKVKRLNIKCIISYVKNQKVQRDIAIKQVKTDLIAQCDDDLELDQNYLINSYKHFSNKDNKILVSAAILFKDKTHQAIRWNNAYYKNGFYRFILFSFNSFKKLKFMSVLNSGRIIPLLPTDFLIENKSYKNLKNLEWVCSTIIYNKLAIKNAYKYEPEEGKKSYYEDVFFSHSLFKKGYKLMIDRSIIAYHPKTIKTDLSIFFKTIKSQKKIVEVFKKSKFFFYIDIIIFTLVFFILKLFKIR